MSNIKVVASQLTALVMGVVACLAFFALSAPAHAEETGAEEMKGREAMLEKVQTLRALIEERRGERQEDRVERKEERAENRAEWKEERGEQKANFMESIADLEGEEKRSAIMDFVTALRAQIAERKAAAEEVKADVMENRDERKAERQEAREDFSTMSRAEKVAAIMARIAKLQSGDEEEDNDADESDEMDDASDDEVDEEEDSEEESEDDSDIEEDDESAEDEDDESEEEEEVS